ncbi:hypothetical protein HJC23_000693 [Cyclotella cryptica]|uniref:Uncharacterized protein n=1 Tax=Cyclotella cryptica TaxID=29204 RepID=A0ABD3Q9C2_9STRA
MMELQDIHDRIHYNNDATNKNVKGADSEKNRDKFSNSVLEMFRNGIKARRLGYSPMLLTSAQKRSNAFCSTNGTGQVLPK